MTVTVSSELILKYNFLKSPAQICLIFSGLNKCVGVIPSSTANAFNFFIGTLAKYLSLITCVIVALSFGSSHDDIVFIPASKNKKASYAEK